MSRSLREAIVGLGAATCCWRLPGQGAGDIAQGDGEALRHAVAQLPHGMPVRVIVGHDVAVHWVQPPPASLQSMDELRLVAATRCAQLYGGSAQDWWVAGDWDATQPFACAAIPRAQARALQGATVTWQTAWSLVCTRAAANFPSAGWSALRTPERVVLWHCTAGRVDTIATLAPGTDPEAAVAQQMQLEVLHDKRLQSGPVHWFAIEGANEAHAALRAEAAA